jgi:hypothetical protein
MIVRKQRWIAALLCAAVVVSAQAAEPSVAIDRLVTQLSGAQGEWRNGLYPALQLDAKATTEEVLKLLFESISFETGRVTSHQILEERAVKIPGTSSESYKAVLVDTDQGKKIVLLQWERANRVWWSRVYDAVE